MQRRGPEVYRPTTEFEPIPKYPVIVTGAASGTGLEIVRALSRQGFVVGIGTRSEEKYQHVVSMLEIGSPQFSFHADLADPAGVKQAVRRVKGQFGIDRVHVVHAAAAGLPKRRELLAPLIDMRRQDVITQERVGETKRKIAAVLDEPDVWNEAFDVNFHGPVTLVSTLAENGLLARGSLLVTLSSIWSDNWLTRDSHFPTMYDGPEIYRNVAQSKSAFVDITKHAAEGYGFFFIDVVIPEIEGTDVGDFVEKNMLPLVQKANPDRAVSFPKVSKARVAQALSALFQGDLPNRNVQRLYVTEQGVQLQKPQEWNQKLHYPF